MTENVEPSTTYFYGTNVTGAIPPIAGDIVFTSNITNKEIGRLSLNSTDGRLTFTGDVDNSTAVFITLLLQNWDLSLRHLVKKNAFKSSPTRIFGDSPKRSLMKTITWRILGSSATLGIAYLLSDSFAVASSIALVQMVFNTALYFIHERLWANLFKNTKL